MKNDQKPDLDLINRVQQARMLHDAQAKPSEVNAVYWIEAVRQPNAGNYPALSSRAGAWIIETTLNEVDALWEKIKLATEAGRLGYKSKVSTSPGPGQTDPQARIIHVRTYDSDDTTDVERVHKELQRLGIEQDIRYEI